MTVVIIVIVTVALIALLAVLYSYASRMKRGLEAPASGAVRQPPLNVPLSETGAASLAHLSAEPILIKQGTGGIRVQLDNRPLVPIVILTDKAAASALREIVAAASQQYGAQWTALVTSGGEASVTVQRLA
jgi:hypothetical protein